MTLLKELIRNTALYYEDRGNVLPPQDRLNQPAHMTHAIFEHITDSEALPGSLLKTSTQVHSEVSIVSKRQSTYGAQPSVSSSGDTLNASFIIKIAVIAGVVLMLIIVMAIATCFFCRRRSKRKASRSRASSSSSISRLSTNMSLRETVHQLMTTTQTTKAPSDVEISDPLSTNHHKTNPSSSKSFTTSVFGPGHDIKNFSRPMSPLVVEAEEIKSKPRSDAYPYPLDRQASSPTDNEVFTAAFQSMIAMEDKPRSDSGPENPPNLHFSETFGKWTPRRDSRQSVQMTFPIPPRRHSHLPESQEDQQRADENFLMVIGNGPLTRSSIASSISTTNTSILDPFDKGRRFDSEEIPPIPAAEPVEEQKTSVDETKMDSIPEIDRSLPLRIDGPDNVTEQVLIHDIDPDEPLISMSPKSSTQGSDSNNYTYEAPVKATRMHGHGASPPDDFEEPKIRDHPSSPPASLEKKQLRTRAVLNLSMDDLNTLANTIQQHRDSWNESSPVSDAEQDLDHAIPKNATYPTMISRPSSTLSILGRSATYPGSPDSDAAIDDILDTITEYSRESLYALYESQYDLKVPQQSHTRSRSASPRTPDLSVFVTPPTSPRYSTGSLLSPMPRRLTQSRPLSPIPELDSYRQD